MQIVLMCLEVGETIPNEIHENTTQFFRVEAGKGEIKTIGEVYMHHINLFPNVYAVVPANVEHEVINTGDEPLKLYTIYSPPHHAVGLVQKRQNDEERFFIKEK
jgi:mannose-6-phosphate isomerase-like protein (cupin superfamily)